jgi:hypothetical protein
MLNIVIMDIINKEIFKNIDRVDIVHKYHTLTLLTII